MCISKTGLRSCLTPPRYVRANPKSGAYNSVVIICCCVTCLFFVHYCVHKLGIEFPRLNCFIFVILGAYYAVLALLIAEVRTVNHSCKFLCHLVYCRELSHLQSYHIFLFLYCLSVLSGLCVVRCCMYIIWLVLLFCWCCLLFVVLRCFRRFLSSFFMHYTFKNI